MKTAAIAAIVAIAAATASAGDLDVARQALRDEMWDIARTHAPL